MIYAPIVYGTFDLNDGETYTVTNLTKELAGVDVDLITIPGRDGAIRGATTLRPIKITCDIVIEATPESGEDRHSANRVALARLTSALTKSGAILVMPGEELSIIYNAVASGGTLKIYPNAFVLEGVTFTVPDGYGSWPDSASAATDGKFSHPSAYTFELGSMTIPSITITTSTVYLNLEVYDEYYGVYQHTGISVIFETDLPADTVISSVEAYFGSRTITYYNETTSEQVTTFATLDSSWEAVSRLDPSAKYRVVGLYETPYESFELSAGMKDVI